MNSVYVEYSFKKDVAFRSRVGTLTVTEPLI